MDAQKKRFRALPLDISFLFEEHDTSKKQLC